MVDGRDLDPPKNSRPSWNVTERGHPRPELQTSSYPVSSSQEPDATAVVLNKGNSAIASTDVPLVYLTMRSRPCGVTLMY